jgi:hypothetical protein|tara:strand:+ start:6332 stop:7063 length:732 start_codon:yes stop_codon:yes gene_type:complete
MIFDQIKHLVREELKGVIDKLLLREMTFNRARKHIEEEAVEFVMISAYRGGKDNPGNRVRHKEMKSAFKDAGFPFVDMLGGYSEEEAGEVTEPSLLVLGYERPDFKGERIEGLFKTAAHLTKRYEQDSFIYGAPAKTSDGNVALRDDPHTGELKPMMDIKAYDGTGNVIDEPWAGPWNSLITAREDDIYWSVISGKKSKLMEALEEYKKFIPLKREHAMLKEYYLKGSKSGLKFLESKDEKKD